MDEHGLRLFENRALRGLPRPKGDKILEAQRKLTFTIFTQQILSE
jgi:hypothetical protein